MARLTTTQANLRGPINRDEHLIDHLLFRVMFWGTIVGAIALLLWTFQAGEWSERRWPTARGAYTPAVRSRTVVRPRPTMPAPSTINVHVDGEVRVAPAVSTPAPPLVELTPEELDRRHTAYLRSHDR